MPKGAKERAVEFTKGVAQQLDKELDAFLKSLDDLSTAIKELDKGGAKAAGAVTKAHQASSKSLAAVQKSWKSLDVGLDQVKNGINEEKKAG